MYTFILLCLFLLSNILITYEQPLTTSLYFYEHFYETSFTIGNKSLPLRCTISQTHNTNHILSKYYNPLYDSTSAIQVSMFNKNIDINDKQLKLIEYIDSIQLEKTNVTVNNFSFYYIIPVNQIVFKHNRLSLPFNDPNINTTSIVHLMKQQGIINRLSYTFKELLIANNRLQFGVDPSLLRNVYKCKVNATLNNWNCKLNIIYVNNSNNNSNADDDNEIYMYNKEISFDVGRNKTRMPCSLVEYLIRNVMKTQFEEGKCWVVEYGINKQRVQCDQFLTILQFRKIVFEFMEFSLEMNLNGFFVCYINSGCFSLFKCKKDYNDTFVFGSSFAKRFELTFDYEDEAIFIKPGAGVIMRENKVSNIVKYNTINILQYLMILVIIFTIINSGIIIIVKTKYQYKECI